MASLIRNQKALVGHRFDESLVTVIDGICNYYTKGVKEMGINLFDGILDLIELVDSGKLFGLQV